MQVVTTALLLSILVFLGGPKIKFEDTRHDFGKKVFRSDVSYRFEFTNTGDAPLVLESHETSCHCTTATYPKNPIFPGESDVVVVKYDATKVGTFFRKVTLRTNAGKETLVIKGEIVKPSKGNKINPITGQ